MHILLNHESITKNRRFGQSPCKLGAMGQNLKGGKEVLCFVSNGIDKCCGGKSNEYFVYLRDQCCGKLIVDYLLSICLDEC